jgi:hypothetical protein
MGSFDSTKNLPVAVQTIGASVTAAAFRILLVPVDTVKTIMQVEGKGGVSKLMAKVHKSGPTAFFHGALATSAATFVGHYPWFAVYNTLQEWVPKRTEPMEKLARNAGIGFAATLTSVRSLLSRAIS